MFNFDHAGRRSAGAKTNPSFDLGQESRSAPAIRQAMNLTDEKPCPDKEATRTTPSRIVEIRQVLEDYANDLREIIKKLRRHLN
jgi:hypothetical protein